MSEIKKEEAEINFERIVKAVPLTVGFFIVCGSLYLATYYQCFHINIFNYLDTTEILTTFLYLIQDIAFIFASLIAEILFVKLILWIASEYEKRRKNPKKKDGIEMTWLTEDNLSFAIIIASVVFCIFYIIKSYLIEINSNYIIKNRDWMGTALVIFTSTASLWIIFQFETRTNKATKNMVIFFALFFVSYSISTAVARIETTVNVPDANTMVVLENDTIRTSSEYYYVGRTNKYVFFYDTKKERADVIPQDKIRKMSFGFQKP